MSAIAGPLYVTVSELLVAFTVSGPTALNEPPLSMPAYTFMPCKYAAACEIVNPALVTYCVTSSEKLGTAANVIVELGTKSSCSRYGPPGIVVVASARRAIVASPPLATVTAIVPDPDVRCGTVTVAVMPPVCGSAAVVAAEFEGVTVALLDCEAGDGKDVGVVVGEAVGAVVPPGVGGVGFPPPPPHAARSAAPQRTAAATYKRVLCIVSPYKKG